MGPDLEHHIIETFDDALEHGYVQVYYQPVIRAISRKLCSFEALARWDDPERGMISPADFIPVLERHRKVHLLDLRVVGRACAKIRQVVDSGQTPVPISINLSRLDFVLCDIFSEIRSIVTHYQIPHDFLYIEITESLMAEQGGEMRKVVERFREAGFQIWMDDFGSGYSSLNVLKDFSFNEIKLDMKFLSSFDQRSRRIMTSVIQMAKEIDIHTLAEGVETEEQFFYLRNIGCEKVQGFYFGRPLPYEESLAHLIGLGIEVEPPAERSYYDSIGRINLLSAVPFMTREEKDSLTTARQLNSIPLAIVEAREDSFSVLFCNAAFEEMVNGTGLMGDVFSQDKLRYPRPYGLLPARLITLMDATRGGEQGRMFFIAEEEYYEIQAKCIAEMPRAYCVLFRLQNLTKTSEAARTERLDDSLRQLYSLFERITLVDLDDDSIMPLYVGTHEDLLSGRTGVRALDIEYANRMVYPADRKGYLEFCDPSTLAERIAASGREGISHSVRTSVRHGRYEWKQHTLLHLEGNTYLQLIRNVDEEVRDFVERTEAEAFEGLEKGSPMAHYVWETLVNSDLIRIFWKDGDRRFLGASRGFLDYYGFDSVDEIVGRTDEDLGWHVQPEGYKANELEVIHEGSTTHNVPGHCIARGENRDILASKTPLYDDNGRVVGLVGYFIDKDLLTENDSRGFETKRRDILTGLLNSRGIHEEARIYRDEYFLRGTDFCRVHVGIDDIASINTQYGYDFGDKAIVALGRELKRVFGKTSAVGRVSGHQLAIIAQVTGPNDRLAMSERAKRVAEMIREIDGVPITLYLSVGSCLFSETETLEEQTKKCEVRLLADHDEHTSVANRQARSSQIFHLYDDLPLQYAVYRVILDEERRCVDARVFYVNHAFERHAGTDSRDLLGRTTRELFPDLSEDWYDRAGRAAIGGEIIVEFMYYAPTDVVYSITASQVIHEGYCCFTYQDTDASVEELLAWKKSPTARLKETPSASVAGHEVDGGAGTRD